MIEPFNIQTSMHPNQHHTPRTHSVFLELILGLFILFSCSSHSPFVLQSVLFKSIRFAIEIKVVSAPAASFFLSFTRMIMQSIYVHIGVRCDCFAHYLLKCILITRKINIGLPSAAAISLYIFVGTFCNVSFVLVAFLFLVPFFVLLCCLVVRFICGMSLTIKISGFNVLCRSVFNIFLLFLLLL